MPFSANPADTTPLIFRASNGEAITLQVRYVTEQEAIEHRRAVESIHRTWPASRETVRKALAIGIVAPDIAELERQLSPFDLRTLATIWGEAVAAIADDIVNVNVAANYVCGAVCSRCTASCCDNPPRPNVPSRMPCPVCDGGKDAPSCKACKGRGYFKVDRCFRDFVPADIWESVRMSRFADEGALPVAGGVLNQTHSFMSFLTLFRSASAIIKNKMTGDAAQMR